MKLCIKFSCIYLITLVSGINAQNLKVQLELDLAKGLSDIRITDIKQDSIGNIWIGTQYGLNKFDSYSITRFFKDTGNVGLPSNSINCLYCDTTGILWIGTSAGLAKYNPNTNSFMEKDTFPLLNKMSIQIIKTDPAGNLFIAGDEGILKYNMSNHSWTNITMLLHKPFELALVEDLLFDGVNHFYVTTAKRGFYYVDLNKKQEQLIVYDNEECWVDLRMFKMARLSNGKIMVGLLTYGMSIYDPATGKFNKAKGLLKKSEEVFWNTVPGFFSDLNGRYWIASRHYGLCEYQFASDSVICHSMSSNNPFGLPVNSINCVFVDRQKNLWLGSKNQGVFLVNTNSTSLRFFPSDPSGTNKIKQGSINTFHHFDSTNLLIGHENGFSIFNQQSMTFKHYQGSAINKGDNVINFISTIQRDPQGHFWFGSSSIGFMSWNPENNETNSYFYSGRSFKKSLQSHIQNSVLLSDGKVLFLGLGYLTLLDTKSAVNTSYLNRKEKEFRSRQIMQISKIGQDSILLHMNNGLLRIYDYAKDTIIPFPINFNNLHTQILTSYAEKDEFNEYWFASNLGILRVFPDFTYRLYTCEDPFTQAKDITGFIRNGNLIWFTNNRSIGVLEIESGKMTYLNSSHGFTEKNINGSSMFKSPSGKIYMGCINGFYELDPEIYQAQLNVMPAKLIKFEILNGPIMHPCTNKGCQYTLQYDQNNFSFQLSSFDFQKSKDLTYEFYLDGFDHAWRKTGTDGIGVYTNVEPGEYTLRYRTKIINQVANESTQVLKIKVLAPFYKTLWFKFLLTLALLTLIYSIIQIRVNSIKREEKLRSDFGIRLHELENSALRAQMNPHFIFNCLNTINAYIQSNDRSKAGLLISQFSKLIRSILNHSRLKTISLKEELDTLALYIEIELNRFDAKFSYQIDIDDAIYPESIEFPSLILQPFVENAILHGLLPSHKSGELKISISKGNGYLLCVIQDNGIGRKKAKELRKNNSHQKSHGLDITLKRIELFNTESNLHKQVSFIDLTNDQEEALGTRIEIPIALKTIF